MKLESAPLRFCLALLFFASVCGCRHEGDAAATKRRVAFIEGEVDVAKLHAWAMGVIEAIRPESTDQLRVPEECWRVVPPRKVHVSILVGPDQQKFVTVYFQVGAESFGLALGRDGDVFAGPRLVSKLAPGVYYFCHRG